MATLPEDVSEDMKLAIDELESAVVDMESRLESTRAERDEAKARQVELEIENSGLRRELSLARERQKAGADILDAISETAGDADSALMRIAEITGKLFGAPSVTIRLAEGQEWGKSINYGASSLRIREVPAAQRALSGDNLPGTVYRENRQVHLPDLDNVDPSMAHWPVMAARAEGTRTVAGTPLRREGKAIGALLVFRDRLAPFTDEELALQQSFADQAVIAIENARLFNETQEALERQTATADILKVIASSPSDTQPVFAAIAHSANRLVGGFSTAVYRVIDDIVHLMAFTPTTPEADEALMAGFPMHRSEVPTLVQVQTGETAQIADAEGADPQTQKLGRARGWRGVTFTPLMNQGAFIGFIVCTRRETGVLGEHHIELLRTFADQAVIAIENTRLFNETREALEQQKASSDILRVISSSVADTQPVFDKILDSCSHLFGSDETAVLLVDDEDLVTLGAYVGSQHDAVAATFPAPLDKSPAGRAIRERHVVHYTDAANDPLLTRTVRQVAQLAGYEAMAYAPMLWNERGIGAIGVSRRKGGFSAKELSLLQTFADQAVIAIQNARLFNEVRQRTEDLSEALQQQTATADVLKVISRSAFDLETVLDALLSSACRLCGADIGTIRYRVGGDFHLAATFGATPEWIEHFSKYSTKPDRSSVFGRTIIEGHTVHIPDLVADPEYHRPEAQKLMGLKAALGVPLTREGEAFGVINLFRLSVGSFEDQQIELVQTFADQAVIAIQNTRLFNETKEALERQTATADILKVIASSPSDAQPVFDAIASSAKRLIGGFSAAVFRFVDGLTHLAAFTPTTPAADEVFRATFPRPVEEFDPFQLAKFGRPVPIPDIEDITNEYIKEVARARGFRSMLFVPLMNAGLPIGLISVTRVETGPFAPNHVELLQTFADQAVIAIENTRLFNEVKARTEDLSEALQQQTATADVLKLISRSAFDLQTVLNTLTESAARLCNADMGAIALGDERGFYHATNYNFPIDWIKITDGLRLQPGKGSLIGRTLLASAPVQIADVVGDPEYQFPDMQQAAGYRSLLGVPLMRSGEPIGVLFLGRKVVEPYTDRQVELVSTFADQAVIAIENIRLFDEVQARTEEVSESLRQQTAVGDVLKTISRSTFDLQPVLDTLVNTAALLCDAEMAFIMRREGDEYRAGAAVGYSEAYIDFLTNHPLAVDRGTVTGRAVMERQPVQIPDVAADPEYTLHETTSLAGQRTALGVPLMRENEPIGVIVLARQRVEPFTQKQIDLVTTFADQAVIAIENVRLFEEVRQRTVDLTESLEQQTATSEVLRVISSSPGDLAPVFDTMLRKAMELCGASFGTLNTFDGTRFHTAATYGLPPAYDEFRRKQPLQYGPGTAPVLLTQGHPFVEMTNLLESEAYLRGEPNRRALVDLGGARCLLAVPLLKDEQVVGNVLIFRQEDRRFSEKQITLLMQFAAQAVIAIENTRLLSELRERTEDLSESLQQQTATADVLKVISRSAFDLEAVMNTLTQSASELCKAELSGLYLREGDVLALRGVAHVDAAQIDFLRRTPLRVDDSTYISRTFQAGVVRNIADVAAETETGQLKRFGETVGFRSILFVPLMRESRSIGIFALARARTGEFSQREVDLVQTFADQAVIAIENVRLFDEVQARTRDLTEALTYQTGSSNILRVIASSPTDIKPVLQAIVESACELCGAYDAVLRLRNGDELEIGAHHGTVPADWSLLKINPYWTAGRAALELRPIHVHDMSSSEGDEYPQAKARALDQGHRTILSVPLLQEGNSTGTLTLRRLEVNPFSDKQIALLQTFADQAVIAIGNVRLFEEVQAKTRDLTEALTYQTGSANILRVIASSPTNVAPVLDAVVKSACELCDAYDAIVRLKDGDYIRFGAHHGPIPPVLDERLAIERSFVTGRAIVDRQTIHLHDLSSAEGDEFPGAREMSLRYGIRTILCAPLLRESESVGAILLRRTEVNPFTDKQIALLQTFADQAVIAIGNVRLFEEVQAKTRDLSEALTHQTGSANILNVIASSPTDVQPVMNAIVESACELCGAYDAVALLKEGDDLLFSAHHGPIPMRSQKRSISRGWTAGRAFIDKKPIHVHDLQAEGNEFPEGMEMARNMGHRSIVSVPLLRDGESIGALVLRRIEVNPFSDKQIALLQTFADQAVIAIGNVRLFEEVQAKTHDLSEALRYQTGSANILNVIASSPTDVQPVLKAIVESACELCDAHDAVVLLRDGDHLCFSEHHGPIAINVDKWPISRGWAAGRAFTDQTTVHVPDVRAEEASDFTDSRELTRRSGSKGVRSILAVPLLRESESVGAILLRREEVRPFNDKQIGLLQTFADQAVIAIGNVRLFEEVQAKTRDLSEALEFQTATGDVLNVISRSPNNLQPVMDTIVQTAQRLCNSEYALILHRRDDGFYGIVGHANASPELLQWMHDNPVAAGDGSAVGIVAVEKKTLHLHDSLADPRFTDLRRQRASRARTMLAVPLLQQDQVIGVVFLARTEVQPFTERQVDLITSFADQAVIAISNVSLFEEVRDRTRDLTESLQQQTATAEVLKVISRSAFDLQTVLETLIKSAVDLSGAYRGSIFLREGDVFPLKAASHTTPEFLEYWAANPPRAGRGSATARVILSGKVEIIPDVQEDAEIQMPASSLARIRGTLGVPMLRDNKVEGVLVLTRPEPGPFTASQIALVQTFADQAVIAVENVRLFDETQARTKELAKSLDDLRTAQDRLVQTEKLASLGQLTAGIAHEIKNPLNFVNNFASLSAELTEELNDVLKQVEISDKLRAEVDELTALLKDNLEKVVQHGKRADSIVKNMLLHSREGGGEHRPSDINALVDESLNLAYHGARAERPDFNVTLQRDFDQDAGQVDLFPQEITRVLLNLVSNGFYAVTKRRKEGGETGFEPTLRASTKSFGESVEIRIRDNGIGIPAEVKEKMFNPFFTTKPAGEGTGLGLSMSHDIIVKQHGGTIDVDTSPGHFTEFRIVLPRTSNLTDKSRG